MKRDPVRLVEQAELPQAERELLDAGRALPPVHYDVAAGAARFRAALDGAAAAGGGSAAGGGALAAGALGSGLKVVLVILAASLGVIGALAIRQAAPDHERTAEAGGVVTRVARDAATSTAMRPGADVAASGSHGVPSRPTGAASAGPERVAAPDGLASAPTATSAGAAHAPVAGARAVSSTAARVTAGAQPQALPLRPERQSPPRASSPAAPRRAQRPSVQAEAPEAHAEPVDTAQPPVAAQPSAQAAQPVAVQRSAASPPPDAGSAPVPQSVDELQAIARARVLLKRDPEAALELLQRVAHDHPHGFFVEERMALTVLALAALGRDEAQTRGEAFLRAYPRSPHAARVRAALEE